jgi:PAS domain S-box-containing protein
MATRSRRAGPACRVDLRSTAGRPGSAVSATPPAQRRLRVLYLEGPPSDARRVGEALTAAGYLIDMELASDERRFEELPAGEPFDVILADAGLPGFDARAALELARTSCPQTPFPCVSATIGEKVAVDLLKGGAVDLVLKDRLARLPLSVERALDEKARRREQEEAEEGLAAAAFEWRRTFNAMRDAVTPLDREGRVLRCNAATAALAGRAVEDIVGQRCFEVFHGAHDHHPDCPHRRALTSGRPETSVIEQDRRWLRITVSPEVDDAGRGGGVHVVTDVSELKQAEQRLRENVVKHQAITEGVIAALARTVDVRDPYTAGHQRRVSELAVAMAERLGLAEASLRGVQIAGMLHDVGKIVVPAEILSSPGSLNAAEFELIKAHPLAAYEILKPVEFDFPVAGVVVQHHERLDGSGYPAGLAGGSILPEARVLAVADVVEAIISDRPYRAALPLDAAADEFLHGAGSRYDAAACDAAIGVCREQGFALSAQRAGGGGTQARRPRRRDARSGLAALVGLSSPKRTPRYRRRPSRTQCRAAHR